MLFLSAAVGVGHTAAAEAVAKALAARDSEVETQTVDSYAYAASVFATVVADGYIAMVKHAPQVYRAVYRRAERATHVPAARRLVSRFTAGNLRQLVRERRPDVVVCTHAFPCGVMAEYKRRFDPTLPVVGVVTDFAVHPFWIYDNVDAYAVATPEIGDVLASRGVARAAIEVSGIPVDLRFAEPRLPRAALRAELGLPQDRRIVLVMGGGIGIGPLDSTMRALGRLREPLAAAVIVGRNPALERRVLAAAERTPYPLRVAGFVTNVHDYMHASDVLVTKPGGLTSAEALAARLPMVAVKPLPGQEERNRSYLVGRGVAAEATGETQVADRVEGMLGPARAAACASIETLRRPHAALAVADRILALLERRRAESGRR